MIDPVVLLVEELRAAQPALRNAAPSAQVSDEAWKLLHSALNGLQNRLLKTVPTSAMGAGELARIIAYRLVRHPEHARRFHDIADRLGAGQRLLNDLVWLRRLRNDLAQGMFGEPGQAVLPLLDLALVGASRPVLVFRAVAVQQRPAVAQ